LATHYRKPDFVVLHIIVAELGLHYAWTIPDIGRKNYQVLQFITGI